MWLEQPQEWITGIAAIRGRDFPVVDLRGKLGIRQGTHGRSPCVIAVEVTGPRLIGFVADRVSEVIELRKPDLAHGTLRIAGRTRRIFDPDQILRDEVALSL
jgi:chemotaxis signal transduction protein